MKISDLKIKIFADGADEKDIESLNQNNLISGFTTNPTLMRKAGVINYKQFATKVLKTVNNKPISFEIFADDFDNMLRQAIIISKWSNNVNVKIPVTNTLGVCSIELIKELNRLGIKINVTAVFTLDQIKKLSKVLNSDTFSIVSVFAGRIADTGVDPMPLMKEAKIILNNPKTSLLWASPREILNVFQADVCGVDIITLTTVMLKKLENIGKPLDDFSLETVKMFHDDAKSSGYEL
jgi:transaldolase